jgi:tetratricopeptide (TPR) repeat protein
MKNLVVFMFLVWGGIFFAFAADANESSAVRDTMAVDYELSEASSDTYDSGSDITDEGDTVTPDTTATTDTDMPETTDTDDKEDTDTVETTDTVPSDTEDTTTTNTTDTAEDEVIPGKLTLYPFTSDYYRVYSDESEEESMLISQKIEACLKLYNALFHFDLLKLEVKLKVKIYGTKQAFDDYVKKFVTEKKNDFIYIHYSDLGKCELVGFKKNTPAEFDQALLHQAFVQFIKAFVPNPPLWLQEGMAAYFEQAEYNEDLKTFQLAGELVWLETLKRVIKEQTAIPFLSLEDLLVIDKANSLDKINTFYPQAWGLVYFLLKSENRDINRILWDSLIVLDSALSVLENSQLVKEKAFGWLGTAKVEEEYKNFFLAQKTFPDLVTEGVNYYSNNELDKAKQSFTEALERDTTNYIPYYYLGLIHYSQKDYLTAETYYNKALELGAPTALIYYALGVNAFADNNYELAVTHLKEAEKLDPDNYKEKVEELLQRIESSSTL